MCVFRDQDYTSGGIWIKKAEIPKRHKHIKSKGSPPSKMQKKANTESFSESKQEDVKPEN